MERKHVFYIDLFKYRYNTKRLLLIYYCVLYYSLYFISLYHPTLRCLLRGKFYLQFCVICIFYTDFNYNEVTVHFALLQKLFLQTAFLFTSTITIQLFMQNTSKRRKNNLFSIFQEADVSIKSVIFDKASNKTV